jgi:hypothetical protein
MADLCGRSIALDCLCADLLVPPLRVPIVVDSCAFRPPSSLFVPAALRVMNANLIDRIIHPPACLCDRLLTPPTHAPSTRRHTPAEAVKPRSGVKQWRRRLHFCLRRAFYSVKESISTTRHAVQQQPLSAAVGFVVRSLVSRT